TAAGTFQDATMSRIAVAGLFLGSLADRFGRRRTVIVGLGLFAASCFLLSAGNTLWFFAVLLTLSGLAIGVFKTGALALIGDVSRSTGEHTSIMNTLEGFFGVGAIVGPALLTRLLAAGRFLGAWMLRQAGWQLVLMVFSGGILACFAFTVIGGVAWGVFLLPLSGLFMSVMYPTINSKGISCVPKGDHGAAAGVI